MSCNVCFVSAAKKCSRCLIVSYCSQEHQRKDWNFHKLNCAKESVDMASGFSSKKKINQSLVQSTTESSSSQAIFRERLETEDKTPIDESFDYTNHSHNLFKNLTGNTMSIGDVNMLNPAGGPNLNFK